MRLIKLTPANTKVREAGTMIYVSADQIVSVERNHLTHESILYTSTHGIYFRVTETPEEIEELANS